MYTIKKDSLMVHFLTTYCGVNKFELKWENPIPDVCTLVRKLINGIGVVLFIIAISVAAGVAFLGWIVPLISMGWDAARLEEFFRASFSAFMCLSSVTVLFLVGLGFSCSYELIKDRFRKDQTKTPTLFGAWYEGFKNKYCMRVKYDVVFKDGRVCKVKTEAYCALHKTKDSINNPKALFQACLFEASDDLRSLFHDDELAMKQITAMETLVRHEYNHRSAQLQKFYDENKLLSRKDFAILGQSVLKEAGTFSLAMNLYLGKEMGLRDWMMKNYRVFGINDVQLVQEN